MLILNDLHILRPWFLLVIPLCLVCMWLIIRHTNKDTRLVSPHVQQLVVVHARSPQWLVYKAVFVLCIIIFGIALSGPSWKSITLPTQRTINPTWVLLDLSWSMAAEDLQPSRYTRATFTISNILRNSPQNAPFSLIAFAGEAFQVVPMSYDLVALENFLGALSPQIMPNGGSNPMKALHLVNSLIEEESTTIDTPSNAPVTVMLVSDDLGKYQQQIINFIDKKKWRLALVSVGKDSTSPIRLQNGTLLRSTAGKVQFATYNPQSFESIAHAINGRFANLDGNSTNLINILSGWGTNTKGNDNQSHQKADQGYLLLFVLLPLILVISRRGVLFTLLCTVYIAAIHTPNTAFAISWRDLWINKENQAIASLQSQKYDEAESLASTTNNAFIEGATYYRKKKWQQALDSFRKVNSPEGAYNAGNAAFQMENYQLAIRHYQQAANRQPHEKLAKYIADNLTLAKQRLAQQQSDNQPTKQPDNQQSDTNTQQSSSQQKNSSNQNTKENTKTSSQKQSTENNTDNTPNQASSNTQNNAQQPNTTSNHTQQATHEQSSTDENTTSKYQQNPNTTQAQTQSDTTQDNAQTLQHIPVQDTTQKLDENDSRYQLLRNSVQDNPQELLRRMFWLENQQRGGINNQNQPLQP